MKISAIMAVGNNGAIGLNNELPWRGKIPGELAFFKHITLNPSPSTMFVGHETFKSFGSRPLAGRDIIVLTSRPDRLVVNGTLGSEKVIPVGGYEAGLSEALALGNNLVVCGGASVYEKFIVNRDLGLTGVYLTEVSGEFEGDTFFNLKLSEYGFSAPMAISNYGKKAGDFVGSKEVKYSWQPYLLSR